MVAILTEGRSCEFTPEDDVGERFLRYDLYNGNMQTWRWCLSREGDVCHQVHASTDQTAVTWAPSLTRFFTDIGHFSMIFMHQGYLMDILSKYPNWFYHNLFYKNELDINVHGPVWSQIHVSLELIRSRLAERSRSVTDSCINSLTSGNNQNVAVPDVSWYQNGG